jgi:hypothetical protein
LTSARTLRSGLCRGSLLATLMALASLLAQACLPTSAAAGPRQALSAALTPTHFAAGFSADTPEEVESAASLGVTVDILYGGPPSPSSALGEALTLAHMHVIDARVSQILFYWECHRTHTVKPPPHEGRNTYCATDKNPSIDSKAVVRAVVKELIYEDAVNPLVSGYWVLDDWPWWDGGSARDLLKSIHRQIAKLTPGDPAICGFGGELESPKTESGGNIDEGFEISTAKNYSNAGCDMVGLYNYTDLGSEPSNGEDYDWSMKTLLELQKRDLGNRGWVQANTPMLGIAQAFAGPYEERYWPGITTAEMITQAEAFCAAGASSIAWYAWHDSGFVSETLTPETSPVIDEGIRGGLEACGF